MTVREIDVTTGEEIERSLTQKEIEEKELSKLSDLVLWERKLKEADSNLLPRWAEDILEYIKNGTPISQHTLDKLSYKKQLRESKPNK